LVTCWPTDALWFTPDRYLVTAAEISQSPTAAGERYPVLSAAPVVPVPGALLAQGVTLDDYSLPMGTMAVSGTPDATWAQGAGPLLVQESAVEAFIAGVRSLVEGHLDWWEAVAPGVLSAIPLVGAGGPTYLSPLDVVVHAEGTQATSATLSDEVGVTAGAAPGRYSMTVTETLRDNALLISAWAMTPSGSS
jgi:hypothetical protein